MSHETIFSNDIKSIELQLSDTFSVHTHRRMHA